MVNVPQSASCVAPMIGKQDNAFLAEKDMCFKEVTAFDLHWESTRIAKHMEVHTAHNVKQNTSCKTFGAYQTTLNASN